MYDMALIKFRNVAKRDFSDFEIFDFLRILNGMGIIIYYLVVLVPNFEKFFLVDGFVSIGEFVFYPKSWIFYLKDFQVLVVLLFLITFLLLIAYTLGYFAKLALVLLLPLHLGFHAANPFIIHEPQQISNLLLILTLFFPIENKWSVKKRKDFFPKFKNNTGYYIIFALLLYLSLYYFFAGLKKIPDPFWRDGSAVSDILSWPYLGRENIPNSLLKVSFFTKTLTYMTLMFELGFIFIAFTRFRRILFFIGIFFHLSIGLTMDVGLFFWSMISWYPVLLLNVRWRLI